MRKFRIFAFILCCAFVTECFAAELKTNGIRMNDAPKWVTVNRIDRVVNRIQSLMEWSIRRIDVFYYADNDAYMKVNQLGPNAIAFALRLDSSVHLGPKVTEANFDQVFGHELVHVISAQKYKDAIPKWLEEGLANHLSKHDKVDYKWLAAQPAPADVRELLHPYGGSAEKIRYHYVASQALAEMLAAKCELSNLLRMSVGRKLDNYLSKLCGISDLTVDFKKWISSRS